MLKLKEVVTMQFFSLTDTGKCRTNNEDSYGVKEIANFTVLVVADGMGGANSGEVASAKAIETVFEALKKPLSKKPSLPEIPRILTKVMDKANATVYKLSVSDSEKTGMGTTLDMCIVAENTVYIAHIGDSRVYKVSAEGAITKLTKDHSLVEYLLETGALTPEEAKHHPQKNIITKALGTAPKIEADIISRDIVNGDRLVICSDGLSNMVTDETIAGVAAENTPLAERAQKLVDLANNAGGRDNITVIIAQK